MGANEDFSACDLLIECGEQLTPAQIMALVLTRNASGCPALSIKGEIAVVPGATTLFSSQMIFQRPATLNVVNLWNYGKAAGGVIDVQNPIWNDSFADAQEFALGLVPNEIVELVTGTFSVGPIVTANGFGGRLHVFRSQILAGGGLPDGTNFNPTMVELQDYVGSFELKAKHFTNGSAYGELEINPDGILITPAIGTNFYYGIIEVDSYVSASPNAIININLIAQRP